MSSEKRMLAAHEVEMAGWRTEVVERLAETSRHVTHNPDTGSVTGWGERFDDWAEAREAAEALDEFAPCDWWRPT